VLCASATSRNGQFLIDEDVLREAGQTEFDHYAVDPTQPLLPDLFLD
jgi:citronellol/citronellal dehydrogenase